MRALEQLEKEQMRTDLPDFRPGDLVKVHVKIKEGEKERIQVFEGTVIRKRQGNNRASFTVRKISYGEGVERVFPVFSPSIESIKLVRRGKVRRAKLYYLRERRGKSARIAEKMETAPKAAGETPNKESKAGRRTKKAASASA